VNNDDWLRREKTSNYVLAGGSAARLISSRSADSFRDRYNNVHVSFLPSLSFFLFFFAQQTTATKTTTTMADENKEEKEEANCLGR
jgi:hypothetical protein